MNFIPILFFIFCSIYTALGESNGLPQEVIESIEKTPEYPSYFLEYNRQMNDFSRERLGYREFKCPSLDVEPPKNIHTLSPKYIEVVAAMGDSLTAANGADARTLPGVALQYRGVSFSIGGDGNLEKTMTVPNIIKKYNPSVFGFSKGISRANNEILSQFNVGVPGSKAKDMPGQAEILVKRIGKHTKYNDAWKLVTIFIGANDICKCDSQDQANPDKAVSGWVADITKALDILANGLTKTFINLVNVVKVGELRAYEYYTTCALLHRASCPCVMQSYGQHDLTDKVTQTYQEAMRSIPDRYSGRSDFTVVLQPLSENIIIPTIPQKDNTKPDLSFLAPDCFHFSQRAHAAAAAGLWNNMFEPLGKKEDTIDPTNVHLICPDMTCPYLRTSVNSVVCSKIH